MSNPYDFQTMVTTPNLAPPPSSLDASDSSLAAGQADLARRNAEIARIEQANQRTERLLDEQEQRMRAGQADPRLKQLQEQRVQQALQPLPQPPDVGKPPPMPTQDDAQRQTASQAWLTAVMFMGALGGAMTRRPITNSLAAFTGALNGFAEGNKERFDQEMKTWEAENKRWQEVAKEAHDKYLDVLENRKLSDKQQETAIQILSAQYNDPAAAQLIHDRQAFVQSLDTQYKMIESAGRAIAGVKEELGRAEADKWLHGPEGQRELQEVIAGRRPPPSQNPRLGDYHARAIKDALPEGFDYNQFKKRGAMYTAEGRVTGQAAASIQLVMRAVGPVLENAAEKAKAVPATAFPRLNRLFQQVSSEISDPALRDFQLANLELAEQLARAMNPRSNVVAVTTQNRALEYLSTADGPEAYDRVLRNIDRFVEREFQITEEQKAGAPLTKPVIPDSTQRAVVPTSRQILPQTGGTTGVTPLKPGEPPTMTWSDWLQSKGFTLTPMAPGQ